jgi:DNA topoisomerase-1
MTELIITEKPAQAEKIALALADNKPTKHKKGRAIYYSLKHKDKEILVGCAVGHLFGLAEKKKTPWGTYPIFDIEWKPKYLIDKNSKYTKEYISLLKELSRKANEFTVSCDYDIEGSLIGFNCIRFIANRKDAKRMKFSTLTKNELINSYENAMPHLDFEQIEAGKTRHHLDWLYGLNLSNALMSSIKNATNHYKIMSTGRVQGPTLKIIVEREKEIQNFKPVPYWEIYLEGIHKNGPIKAQHEKGQIKNKEEVKKILEKTKNQPAIVSSVVKKPFTQPTPTPFDLTTLQTEAFRALKLTPKETSQIAQNLYIAGLISYPRTSSQKLPKSIGYERILNLLSQQKEYSNLCKELLKGKLKPNEGKKTDPAHPAIFPTGEKKSLSGKEAKLYDLIVRRFLSTFAPPATRQTTTIKIDVNKETFVLSGTLTLDLGWQRFYGNYAVFKEEEVPKLEKGDEIKVKKIYELQKETQPPKRYTQASIIKQMEALGIGTKATRAIIVDALYQRNYIQDQPIKATPLGIKLVKTLEKYSPQIIDVKLTRHFEQEMEKILNKKTKKEKVIEEAKKVLTKILKDFKKNEIAIGKELTEASYEAQSQANEMGICPKCQKGKLRIIFSKKTKKRYVVCDGYPKCKTIYNLPQQGLLKPSKSLCKHDNFPQITVIRKGKRPWTLCLNPECKSKKNWNNKNN